MTRISRFTSRIQRRVRLLPRVGFASNILPPLFNKAEQQHWFWNWIDRVKEKERYLPSLTANRREPTTLCPRETWKTRDVCEIRQVMFCGVLPKSKLRSTIHQWERRWNNCYHTSSGQPHLIRSSSVKAKRIKSEEHVQTNVFTKRKVLSLILSTSVCFEGAMIYIRGFRFMECKTPHWNCRTYFRVCLRPWRFCKAEKQLEKRHTLCFKKNLGFHAFEN